MDTSYLTQQVTTIIGQLHSLFDEIGVPNHERDSRESELFASLSETLHNHLKLVAAEKNDLAEQCQRIITTLRQMEASLEDNKPNELYAPKEDDLKITYPLTECLELLKTKHKTVSKLHQERFEQVKKLLQALESYSSHLEPSFLQIKLPPVAADGSIPPTFDLSPTYIASVDNEFTRVYEEYNKRVSVVQQLAEEIVNLWAELGTPQAQTDTNIVHQWRESPEQLGLHEPDITRLRLRRDKLMEEKRTRDKRVKDLRSSIESLWERLGVEERDRKAVNARTRGCGLKVINDLEDELARLNELKRQNLHLFVEDARTKLQALWDELYISEEEAVEFAPMFHDVYSDALLSAHEAEISRLEVLKEKRAPTLQLIAKHRALIKDRDDLTESCQDASRLMLKGQKGERRDPGKLLREEKMRKRVAKELPKVEQDLVNVLTQWEEEYGRPFLVFGERYLDMIAANVSRPAPPPRSKTPNALPAPAKIPKSAGTAPRIAASREPSTLRSKTPVSTLTRHPTAVVRSVTDHRSPSRIPSRMPLATITHGGNSPERSTIPRGQSAKENGFHKTVPAALAPPPKMRDLATITATPTTIQPEDFSRSGSIVRHIPPEDPYNDLVVTRPPTRQLAQPSMQSYREMPPPPKRPAYPIHDQQYAAQHESVIDTTPSTSSIPASTPTYYSNRQVSGASTATTQSNAISGGSENWESYDDGDGSEPEPDASEGYWNKVQMQQQAKFMARPGGLQSGMSMRLAHHTGGVGMGITSGRRSMDDGVE